METTKGRIDKISRKTGKNKMGKDYTITAVELGGKMFSTFNNFEFEVGDTIQLNYLISGKYNNIESVVFISKETPTIKTEMVADAPKSREDSYQEGQAFGLACNLGLRKTLAHWDKDGGQLFEDTYKHNVKMLFRWNKELRDELTK